MAEKNTNNLNLTLCIQDEGYYRKFFSISPTTNLKKLLDAYRSHLCKTCSRPELLNFWFNTVQIQDGDTAQRLGMTEADIIDVRIRDQVTRGACPIPAEQTIPNIHYLALPPPLPTAAGPSRAVGGVSESQPVPTSSVDRITIQIKDQHNAELMLRIKKNTPFRKVLEAYSKQAERSMEACRLMIDGQRLGMDDTPEKVDMEDGDMIDVYMEQLGGCEG